ncbi:MAG: hypothetical protein R2710_18390 [Acidimicrobiales bacterium]
MHVEGEALRAGEARMVALTPEEADLAEWVELRVRERITRRVQTLNALPRSRRPSHVHRFVQAIPKSNSQYRAVSRPAGESGNAVELRTGARRRPVEGRRLTLGGRRRRADPCSG